MMNNPQALKLQLVETIINLPDDKLQKVSEFIKSILVSSGHSSETDKAPEGDDPILKLIGISNYTPPSKSIDEELYGEP
jgi:hypothetical protein